MNDQAKVLCPVSVCLFGGGGVCWPVKLLKFKSLKDVLHMDLIQRGWAKWFVVQIRYFQGCGSAFIFC